MMFGLVLGVMPLEKNISEIAKVVQFFNLKSKGFRKKNMCLSRVESG
jgi:hypothetical protein